MSGIVKGYALEAVLGQLQKWQEEGEQSIYFGALSTHPQADEDCTFGELIQQAIEEAHLGKYYWSEDGPSLRKLVWVCSTCQRRSIGDTCGNCGATRPSLRKGLSLVEVAKSVFGMSDSLLDNPEMDKRARDSARMIGGQDANE